VSLPQVIVDVGFTGGTTDNVFTVGDPTLGQVGVVPIGDPDTWVDVSEWVRSWSVKRGAGRGDDPTLRFDPGTCSIELNDGDRRFDPENVDGPYVVAGVTQVEPMRRVRIRAVWAGVTHSIFYGYADDWVPSYVGNVWTYVTLTATDATKLFQAEDREAVTPVGAGESSATRVARILNAYGWSSTFRSISSGDTTLQATDLSGNMLAELQLVQDTEQGQFWIGKDGKPTWGNRRHILTYPPSTTSQATFGDGGYLATGEIPYADAIQSTPGDTLVNTITATRVDGTAQTAEDAVSVARYLPKSHSRSDLIMQTDEVALQWAHWLKYQYANPARRFARVEFNTPAAHVASAYWPAVLGREMSNRITIIRRPAGGGDPIERDCFIRGIEHSQTDAAEWKIAFILQGADRFSFFVVGDPIYGRVGHNAVAY
jgi:hypothetical protein